jgi:hypothetical protein
MVYGLRFMVYNLGETCICIPSSRPPIYIKINTTYLPRIFSHLKTLTIITFRHLIIIITPDTFHIALSSLRTFMMEGTQPCKKYGIEVSESQGQCPGYSEKDPHRVPTPSPSPKPEPKPKPTTPPPAGTPSPPMT